MEFRILGPLHVEDQGRKLPLGGPAERHLLAVLLCLANEPVPMQRLIDELWGDDPPTSARNVVQQYVSHLRRALEDDTRLTTEPGGYVLRIEPEELDWQRFRKLASRARTAENCTHTAALLREALDLWEGQALSGAGDGPTVSADRIRLEEARLGAIEDRVDCDLDLGRHCELTAELESLVAQHPHRERLLGQLMLALYRCDRQPEALRHYDDYRRSLGEDTGLEPGTALADLEGKILTDDPGLTVPAAATETPTNLPQRLSSFVGRETEIGELTRRLAEHRLVTLVGTGGIGKTSLGLRLAAELTNAFPDGIWWVDLAPLGDSSLVGGTAAAAIGMAVEPGQDPLNAVADHLQNQMALIVLDNCEHLIDGAADLAFRVLRAAPDVSILATSREPLGVEGEALMRVPSLSLPDDGDVATSEAVRLFVDRVRLLDPDFTVTDVNAEQVVNICRQLDGIPLAIELAAARMSTMALDQIADGIDDRYELLTKGARTAPRRHQTLRALVDWSHDLLTNNERIVFRRLSVFAGSFTAAAAEFVCGYRALTPEEVALCLDQLVEASLVESPEPSSNRFRMLETIREYSRKHLAESGEIDPTMRRLAEYLIEAGPESEDGYPVSDVAVWYRWRSDERDNYRSALEWAYTANDADIAAALTIEFRGYLNESNLNTETAWRVAQTMDLLGDEQSHRQLLLAWMQIGDHINFGDYETARDMASSLYRRAQVASESGTMGMARGYEAMATVREGEVMAALPLFEEACTHLVDSDDPRANDVLSLYAFHLSRTGAYEAARAVLQRMRDAAQRDARTDSRFVEYIANLFGAWVEQYAGNLDDAERMLANEETYVTNLGAVDLFIYYLIRFMIGVARNDESLSGEALDQIDRSVDASGSPGLKRDVATAKAMYTIDFGDTEEAIPFLQSSLDQSLRYYSLADTAEIVFVMGDAAYSRGHYGQAATVYAAALAGYQSCGIVLTGWQKKRLDQTVEVLRDTLGEHFDDHWGAGAAMPFDEMVSYAADYIGLELPAAD